MLFTQAGSLPESPRSPLWKIPPPPPFGKGGGRGDSLGGWRHCRILCERYCPWPCFGVTSLEQEYQRAKRWVRTFPARAYEPVAEMKGSDTTSAPRGCPSEEMRSVVPGSQNSRPSGPSNCYPEPSNRRTPLLSGLPPSVFDVQGSKFDVEPRTAAACTVVSTSLVRHKY